ncbi:MAG: serine O-acetyltransferase [Campylobacterales bacterium]
MGIREFFRLLKEDLMVVKNRDPAFKNWAELPFCYPGVVAILHYRLANLLYRKGFRLVARVIMGWVQFLTNIDIHPGATIGRNVFIDHGIGVVIGETAEVGDNVTIYQGVTLGGVTLNPGKRHPTIEKDCIIGAGAKILGNIRIGKGSKIGANSVVVKDVPPYSTVVGIPGKVIKRKDFTPLAHNKLPDIEQELFHYLMDRINLLEEALVKGDRNLISRDKELERKYREYIDSLSSPRSN